MEGTVLRRVIPSDNSCLFNAVGYVMEHNKNKASELRQVIAVAVGSDPTKYNEAFLGKPNQEYVQWILNPEKWGGAIELSILSEYYGCEIAAYDIQTTRCDLYGQDKKYNERVMLIYDGLHYDALAMSPADGAPEEFDQTIFGVYDGTIGVVERLAINLVKDANRKRSFTDTARFTLRCGDCQIGVVGEKEAVQHAQATGFFMLATNLCVVPEVLLIHAKQKPTHSSPRDIIEAVSTSFASRSDGRDWISHCLPWEPARKAPFRGCADVEDQIWWRPSLVTFNKPMSVREILAGWQSSTPHTEDEENQEQVGGWGQYPEKA